MASKRIMRYKCPYCEKRMERKPLVIHVEDKHDDMIPEGYTAFRVVFNYINKKPLDYNGKCTECGGPTRWDEEKGRYDRQCSNPKCKESYLKKFEENMMRTRGVTRMSQTAEGQKQMLANRKISGTYKFQDGGVKTYTGSYELKALEFMDKILEIKSDDILAPGPILEYSYQGKTHIYITDFYYQPYNLIIEVKDGGNNPNKRDMPEYRAKQIAKEQYIIKHTNYNYLRLTNNDFGQLMTVFADLKYEMQENTGERVIHVNESYVEERVAPRGEVTIYHGSCNGDYKQILHNSPNYGKKWEKIRQSSFWFLKKEYAVMFATAELLQREAKKSLGKDTIYILIDNDMKTLVNEEYKDFAEKIMKSQNCYVYIKTIDGKHLSGGQGRNFPEYTLDFDVTPDEVYKCNYNDMKNSIKYVSAEYIDSVIEKYKKNKMTYGNSLIGQFIDNIIYADHKTVVTAKKVIKGYNESKDVSTLTDGFKTKSGKTFKLVDVDTPEALKYVSEKWRESKNGKTLYVALSEQDDYEIAGFIGWNKSGNIAPLRVYEKFRGYGLSEILLKLAIKNGGHKLGVYSDNEIAIKLYKKFGFVEVDRKTYKDGDVVIMMELQSKVNESSLTEANVITINESASKIYYRVTCNGEGIYEALKKAIGHDEWIKLLNDKAINWLPKPPKYNAGYESYFTKEGYRKFNKYTLPIILKYIDEDFIDVKKYTDSDYIVYRDKYQVVTSQPLLPVQEAYKDGDVEIIMMEIPQNNNESYKEISDEAIDEAFNIFDFIIKKSNLSNNIKYANTNNKTQANTFENLGGALFNQVKLDHNNKQFIIKGINFEKFLLRLKEMYQYRGITKLFEKKYSNFELKLWKLGLKSKNSMKVRELNIPLYFALEMYNIFTALGDFYNLDFYKNIAKNIYRKTWVSNFEDRTDYKKLDTNIINNIFNSEYKLKDYQKTFIEEYGNFKYIYDLVGYILCFEQGLGKTLTSLALAETLKKDQIIIICPNSLKENWVNEIGSYYKIYNNRSLLVKDVYAHGVSRFTSSKNPKFIIVNQESIDKISNIVKKGKNSIIIVDEIHNFRNIDSDRSKALINLKESIDCKDNLLMSGTPIKANATEIIPMLRMIDPYFTEELANIYKKAFNNNTIEVSDVVKTRFSRIIYRKTKDEVLSLPNKTISNLELPCKNSSKYISSVVKAEIVKEIKAQIESRKDSINKYKKIFEEMVLLYSTASHKETKDYLKYIAAIGSEYVDEDEADYQAIIYKNFLKTNVYPNITDKSELKKFDEARTNYVYFKQSCIGKAIGKILPPANTECYKDIFDDNINIFIDYINKSTKKTVIFTPFLEVANYVNNELNKKGIGSVKIVGNVSNRMDIINKFKFDDSIDVLVATVQTLSTGVTLTEADQMFFLGVPYRKADFDQACDRIHRIGQTKDVSIYVVLLKTKEANITNRLSDIMNNSGESSNALIYFENTDIQEENIITEAISPSQYHPVYLISMSYKSPLEKPIELFTGSKYAHSTVVVDNDFDHMYSFNGDSRKTLASKFLGGFSAEPLGLFKKINPKGLFTTSVLFVKNADYKKLKDRLTYYIDNSNNTKYNFAGLLNVPINRETITKENRMFCSQFVDALFKFIDVDITGKSSNVVSPKDIANIRNKKVYNIYTGNIEDFDPQQCIKLTKKLSKTSDYIKEEFEFVEAAEILNEGVIRNEPDVMYNKKLFDAGDINLCFVTGHSGSGKSTFAYNYTKNHPNTEIYELDDVIASYRWTDEEFKEYGDLIYSFFKKNPKYRIPQGITSEDQVNEWCKNNGFNRWKYYKELTNKFVEYSKSYAKIHSKKYIVEGIQLFCFCEPKMFDNYAFYIKGTSATLSWIRSLKRDIKTEGIKAIKIKWMQIKDYGFYEKQLYKFRDYFAPKCRGKGYGEDSMSEAAFNELMSAIGYAPVVGIEKSDAYIVNYMSNKVFSGEPSEGVKRDAIGVTNTRDLHDVVGLDDEQKLKRLKLEEVHNPILYKIGMTNEQVSDILYSSLDTVVDENFIYESLTNQTVYGDVESQAKATLEAVSVVDMEKKINKICENYLLPPDDIDIALSDLEAQVANMRMDIYNE